VGVITHVRDEGVVVDIKSAFIAPGRAILQGLHNSMMSLYSFNRLTMEFILDGLIVNVSDEVKDIVRADLEQYSWTSRRSLETTAMVLPTTPCSPRSTIRVSSPTSLACTVSMTLAPLAQLRGPARVAILSGASLHKAEGVPQAGVPPRQVERI
jgi:hypothetical protein